MAKRGGAAAWLEALRAYAPKRTARLRGAKTFRSLERLTDVPTELRALWSVVDGASEVIVPNPRSLDDAIDLLSVADAASELASLKKQVHFPEAVVPFATDGAGNYLAVDARGRVVDWDHETRKLRAIAPSVEGLLARTTTAMKKKALFGGPEGPANATIARIVDKLERWLAGKPGVEISTLFGNDIFRVVLRDPAVAQQLLDVVEAKLEAAPKARKPFVGVYLEKVAKYRQRAKKK